MHKLINTCACTCINCSINYNHTLAYTSDSLKQDKRQYWNRSYTWWKKSSKSRYLTFNLWPSEIIINIGAQLLKGYIYICTKFDAQATNITNISFYWEIISSTIIITRFVTVNSCYFKFFFTIKHHLLTENKMKSWHILRSEYMYWY